MLLGLKAFFENCFCLYANNQFQLISRAVITMASKFREPVDSVSEQISILSIDCGPWAVDDGLSTIKKRELII